MNFILNQCRSVLCEDAINEVTHYVEHNEIEIGFEGLFIELMQVGSIPECVDREACIELGVYLNLNVYSVLDDEFWRKFIAFIKK